MNHSNFADTNPAFELSPIKAIELAAAKIPGAVSLAQGIPSFSTPEVIRSYVIEQIQKGSCDKYSLTTGLTELRQEIALALARDGLNYDSDSEIIATTGSIEGITASIFACTSPGDEVILPSPTYTSYQGAIRMARCHARFVELDEDNNFDFHVERLEAAITKRTKAILFCSPNNPTGTIFSEQSTRRIAELALKYNLTLIADEVYKDFYYTEDKHFSVASIPEVRDRTIRVCSFSKAFSMTGWRIGFVHSDCSIIRQIVKFHDAMVTCAPVVSQYAAIAALRHGAPIIEEFRSIFRTRRNKTLEALDSLSTVLDYQLPKASYFVFPRIKDTVPRARTSTALCYDILEKAGVAVVPGVAFGPSGESHIRISFGRDDETLQVGLTRLQEYFHKKEKPHPAPRNFPVVEPVRSFQPQKLLKSIGAALLGFCARIYLKRRNPTVIGIAGLRGKTVFKRVLLQALQQRYSTRAGILSYNTEIGFPLAILGLATPQRRAGWFVIILLALWRALTASEHHSHLILEYGIRSPRDAQRLLSITTPDWLVLTDIPDDELLEQELFLEGLQTLIKTVGSTRILWPAYESAYHRFSEVLDQELRFTSEPSSSQSAPQLTDELVSQSSRAAAQSAALLMQLLDTPR